MYFRFLLTFFIIFGFVVIVGAQNRSLQSSPTNYLNKKSHLNARDNDIVSYPASELSCSDSVTIYVPSNTWGYISGTNGYFDKVKAQKLEFTGSAEFTVIGALAYFDLVGLGNDGPVTAEVYSVMSDGAPGQVLQSSMPVMVSQIVEPSDTAVEFTIFGFSEAPTLQMTEFFVGINFDTLYTSLDTIGLFTTFDSCGSGSDSYEMWVDGNWASIDTVYPLNADFLLEAVVDFVGDSMTTSTDNYIGLHGLQLYPATPNPASTRTVLNYGLENDTDVTISVFDSQGKQIQEIKAGVRHTGIHQQELFTHDFAPGTYYYRIATPSGALVSRFMVQR